MYKNYTFSQDHHSLTYNCSKKNAGCKGRVKLNRDGSIFMAFMHHNHEPPTYVLRSSGDFKVSSRFDDFRNAGAPAKSWEGGDKRKRKWSPLWNYFDKLDAGKLRCRLCVKKINGNKERHIQVQHPATYEHIKKLRKQIEVARKAELKNKELARENCQDRKSSTLWTFFDDLGGESVRCKLCCKTFSKNMGRHLQKMHVKAFNEYKKQKKMKKMDTSKAVVEKADSWNDCLRKMSTQVGDCYECNICKKKLKLVEGTMWNMRRHISVKHPKVYKELAQQLKKEKDATKSVERNNDDKPKPRWAWVRKYCEEVDDGVYKCNLCGDELRMRRGMLNNMKRHVISLHPRAYEEELRLNADGDDIVINNEAVEYIVEYVDIESNIVNNQSNIENVEADKNVNETQVHDENVNETEVQDELHELIEYLEDSVVLESQLNLTDSVSNKESPPLAIKQVDAVKEVVIDLLSVKDPDLENKIKNLCQLPAIGKGKRAKRDCIWNFYSVIAESRLYACLFCNRDITISPGSCANLKRHLAGKHKKQYAIIQKYDPALNVAEESVSDQTTRDMPSLEPSSETRVDFEITEDGFVCKLCNAAISLEEDKGAVIKHIVDYHPEEEVLSHDGDQFAVLAVGETE